MKFEYEEIKKFLENYFKDYSSYAQDAENMSRMNKYWAPDFKTTAYLKLQTGEYPQKFFNRDDWEEFLIEGHRHVLEELVAKEIIVDTDDLKAAVMLEVKKFDRATKKSLCNLDGIGFYRLGIDESNLLKIKTLDFFCGKPEELTNLYKI